MTRAQANALSTALGGQAIPHEIVFTYDAAGIENASVSLSPAVTYTGGQLAALSNYCTQHALALSINVASMGVV